MIRCAVVVACAVALTSCSPEATTAPTPAASSAITDEAIAVPAIVEEAIAFPAIVEEAIASSAIAVHRVDGYVGSDACASCHRREHRTWHSTYHRTMTRLPHPEAVLGAFDGRELRHGATRVRVASDGDGAYMELSEGEGSRRADVALVVGSHRYQQYFERVEHGDGERLERLPFLWHIDEKRWLHLNTVFLGPDDVNPDRHRALWNVNCVFCHNTGPRPGIHDARATAADATFSSSVAEVGIACEACHGPGAEHVESARARQAGGGGEAKSSGEIVHPLELDAERELAVCGQCHGQRLPRPISNITRYLAGGPTYRPGDRLEDHVTPVERETPSPSSASPDLFRDRFWRDGTPRLTAYEYQGVVDSACRAGGLTCSSCHTMHGGDPDGMVEDAMRGSAACADCHAEIVAAPQLHTHHAAEGPGSNCYDCHMPHIAYGVLGIRRSHRIEIPDIDRDVRQERPNACTLCHLDFTADEVRQHAATWWGKGRGVETSGASTAHAIRSLHGGDPVQRAVYTAAFGRDGAGAVAARPALAAHLAVVCGDGYPSLRFLARRSLLALGVGVDIVADWDTSDPATRREIVAALLKAAVRLEGAEPKLLLDADGLALESLQALLESQSDKVIDIGE